LKGKNETKFSALLSSPFLGFASSNNFHFLELPKWRKVRSKAMKRRKTHNTITTITTTTIFTTKTKNKIN
jgi:hypothetical protein